MIHSDCKVMISKLWVRFVPHFCSGDNSAGRVLGIPDEGMNLPLGESIIKAIPAHFMHSEGNFQFYDPIAKILFSGDMGASLVGHTEADTPVENFKNHIQFMEGFHKRYMISNKICRLWVSMVRQLDIEAIVPQHGRAFVGKKMVNEFLNWIEGLPCGIDLLSQDNYRIPAN
jgi:flavorubredoxin